MVWEWYGMKCKNEEKNYGFCVEKERERESSVCVERNEEFHA